MLLCQENIYCNNQKIKGRVKYLKLEAMKLSVHSTELPDTR
jgi:hypothetical protein